MPSCPWLYYRVLVCIYISQDTGVQVVLSPCPCHTGKWKHEVEEAMLSLVFIAVCTHSSVECIFVSLLVFSFFLSLSLSLFLFAHALRCTSYLSLSADSIQPAGVCLSGVCQQGGEEHERKNGTVVEERVRYLYAYKNTTSSTMTNYAENQSTTTTIPAPTMRTSQTFARSHHHSF